MQLTEIRSRSKKLVHTEYRLEVAAAVHGLPPEELSPQPIVNLTGIAYPRVVDELHRLKEVGMLSLEPRSGQTTFYRVAPTSYFEMCARLLAEFRAQP